MAGAGLSHLYLITVEVVGGPGLLLLCCLFIGPGALSELLSLPISSEEAGGAEQSQNSQRG